MTPGACLCGAVRYEVDELAHLTHCHCSLCRKHHGAPFASFVEVPRQSLRWLAEDAVAEYRSSPGRARRFCSICSAVAPTLHGDRYWVPAGNLDGDLGALQSVHAFVGSKAPWHVIGGDAPRYEGAAPGAPDDGAHGAPAAPIPTPPATDAGVPGSCACGAVTFVVSGAPARWLQCHCSRCRRGRSAVHGSNMFYPLSQFAWRAGQDLVRRYKLPEAERFTIGFCARCGGGTPVVRDNVPFVLVPAALLDADPGARPEAHIFVASRATWYTVADGLPQYAELPPA